MLCRRSRIRRFLILSIFVLNLTCRLDAYQDDWRLPITDEEKLRVCSLFNVLKDNAEAIQTCDVLIVREVFFDGVNADNGNGVFSDTSTVMRLTSDFTKRRFSIAAKSKIDEIDIGNGGEKNKQSATLAYAIDFEKGIFASYQNDVGVTQGEISKARQVSPGFEERFLSNFGDPRTLGLMADGYFKPLPDVSKKLSLFARGIGFRSVSQSADSTDISITSYEVPDQQYLGRHVISFDLKTSMPIRVRGEDWSAKSKVWGRLFDQSMEWKELDGIMVPIRINEERSSARFDSSGKQHFAVDENEYRLHWISVNKQLPSSFFDGTFDGKGLADANSIDRWLDVEKLGATELTPPKSKKVEK
jgi:hypothetical protein